MSDRPEQPDLKIGILSAYWPGMRFASYINHKAYADNWGYYYIFNSTPERDTRKYFHKIETILRYLDLFDWVFWIDDDAYFTNFEIPLTHFLSQVNDEQLLICKSPSTKKIFTKFSSGQFFLKSTPLSKQFLRDVLNTNMAIVEKFWQPEKHGYYTGGDQEAMVYLSETHPCYSKIFFKIIDHNYFNNRDFEFDFQPDEHFLVHFTGTKKQQSHEEFCRRLEINQWIIPDELVGHYQVG